MKTKIKFSDIAGMLERDEMREISGACGTNYGGTTNYWSGGAGGYSSYYSGSSILSGFGGGTAIGSSYGGQTYSGYDNSTVNNYNSGPPASALGYTVTDPIEISQVISNLVDGRTWSYNPTITYDEKGGHLGGITIFYGSKDAVNNLNPLGAFQLGWDTKSILTSAAFEGTAELTAAEAKYLSFVGAVGLAANVLAAGKVVLDAKANGLQPSHVADLFVQAVIYDVALAVPVAGWIVGGAYFIGDKYFKDTHDGVSITQYYLNNH